MRNKSELIDAPERRGVAVGDFELRAQGDTLKLTGYASVFESPYDVYGGPPMGWAEVVDRKAFDKTLREKPDLHLLINHEGMPLARTKSGTLRLSTDSRGLVVTADLDRRDPDVQRLETKMDRGDMDEMSFAFRVKQQAWNEDETERRLLEVSLHKGDVSVVNFGANPATSAQIRGVDAALDLLTDPDAVMAELRSAGPDALARLTRARDALTAAHRNLAPRRTMSVADALAVLDD